VKQIMRKNQRSAMQIIAIFSTRLAEQRECRTGLVPVPLFSVPFSTRYIDEAGQESTRQQSSQRSSCLTTSFGELNRRCPTLGGVHCRKVDFQDLPTLLHNVLLQ
jgi:hypothetical protein